MTTRKPVRADGVFESSSKAGTDKAASRSHTTGAGHDERGRYGKSVPDPDCRESTGQNADQNTEKAS